MKSGVDLSSASIVDVGSSSLERSYCVGSGHQGVLIVGSTLLEVP